MRIKMQATGSNICKTWIYLIKDIFRNYKFLSITRIKYPIKNEQQFKKKFYQEGIQTINKDIRCSKSLVTGEMQIKTTPIRYHYIATRIAKIKKIDNTSWQGCRPARLFINCWWDTACWKIVWQFSTDTLLLYKPAIPLCVYPRDMKTHIHTKMCAWIFTIALYILAKN